MTGAPVDQGALVDELTSTWLPALADDDRAKAVPLVRELVADWAREADPMPDPAAVVRYQREDLEATTARNGGDRLRGLELELLQRRLNRLSAATFELAQETIDGEIGDEESRRLGRDLLGECEELSSELQGFGSNAVTDAMRRSLGEAVMDALYAVERKAMSQRLAHARPEVDSQADGPPDISA
jgi:hypothetical protein